MVRHYSKVALRSLGRQKLMTAINIAGLSIGLACFSLFLLYSVNEFSFDRFHENGKNIYRIYRWVEAMHGDEGYGNINLPMPLGPAIKQDLSGVEEFVRVQEASETYVKYRDNIHRIKVAFADPQFFSVFSFELKSGNSQTALNGLNDIVVTEKIAKQVFGNENPLGQIIQVKKEDHFESFTVSAVVKDPASNSTIRFEALGNFNYLATTVEGKRVINNWNRRACITYVQLKPGSKLPADQNSLTAFRKKYYPDEEAELRKLGYWKGSGAPARFGLQPLLSIHTDTSIPGGDVPSINPKTVWILLGIAFAVLLIACINFTTLAIGRSASRAREIGIRKVVGSARKQLVWQFLSESLLLTVFSAALGLMLSYLLLPAFNQLAAKDLSFSLQQFPELIWLIIGLTLVVGLLSGSYPALILSGFKPLDVLKQKLKVGGSNLFTRSLVTVQFVLSIALIVSTFIILQQLNFMTGQNPGFKKENIVVVNANDADALKIYPLFKQAVSTDPNILDIAGADVGLGEGQKWIRASLNYKGKPKEVVDYLVDANYIPLMGLQIIRGRNFDPSMASDTTTSVIVNEAMVRDFGWTLDNAVGQPLIGYSDTEMPVVIGVVKDFHYGPFSEKVEPQMFEQLKKYAPHKFFVRISPGDPSKALASLNKAWSSLVPDLPFRYDFLDESLNRFYKSEVRWGYIIGSAGAISIFLACLGLLGLASLAAVNRTKEIGIRKVLGASVAAIIGLLSKDFLKLVVIAIVIASPLTWYFMNKWLQDYAYRINIQWWIFGLAGLIAIVIAIMTISVQSIRAAVTNPVKSLRTE